MFVDARDAVHYDHGHVPGAWLFDPYRPEKYYGSVLPACGTADEVVVYCNGGACEDSRYAAALLRDAGVPVRKLRVYSGGIAEWSAQGLPVEHGEWRSGLVHARDERT